MLRSTRPANLCSSDRCQRIQEALAIDRRQRGDIGIGRVECTQAGRIEAQLPLDELRLVRRETGIGEVAEARRGVESIWRLACAGEERTFGDAFEQMRGRLVERIGPAGIAEDVPPQRDRAVRAEQVVDASEGGHGVEPVEGGGAGGEVEGILRQVGGLEGRGEHVQTSVVDVAAQKFREPRVGFDRNQARGVVGKQGRSSEAGARADLEDGDARREVGATAERLPSGLGIRWARGVIVGGIAAEGFAAEAAQEGAGLHVHWSPPRG